MRVFNQYGISCVSGFLDLEGNPVEKNRYKYPYSYDAYVQWRGGENDQITGCVYSDRMMQWDWDKFNSLSEKHFGNRGQMFGNRSPDKIEAFLKDYFGKPELKLIVIQECCNVSSGYPIWIFHYSSPEA